MPMSRYEIRNEYSLADPELYRAADKDDPEALLEGVAMAGLVGVLRQLGDLAEFAAEIFHNLHEDVMATSARGHALAFRVQQIETEIPAIERAFLSQTDHSSFFYHPGVDWHHNSRLESNLITQGDMPRFIMDSYEECREPPRLFLLDKFDIAGAGACLKRYTDPSFFKVESSEMTSADIQREKKIRKAKRKGPRWRNRETHEVVPTTHAKLHQLFLEERVENSIGNSRGAKLKRKLNGFPFNSKSGKSYMEKILKSPSPDHKVLHDKTVDSPKLTLATNSRRDSAAETFEFRPSSPYRQRGERKRSTPSPDRDGVAHNPPTYDSDESNIDDGTHEPPSSHPTAATNGISCALDKVTGEKVVAVDAGGSREGSLAGYESEDMASEIDNFVDAPSTMELEMERDSELRMKREDMSRIQMESLATDTYEEPHHSRSSDSQSTGDSTMSDVANNSSTKEISRYSSDSPSVSAEKPQSASSSTKGYPYTDISVNEIVGASSYQETNEDVAVDHHSKPVVSDDARTGIIAFTSRRSWSRQVSSSSDEFGEQLADEPKGESVPYVSSVHDVHHTPDISVQTTSNLLHEDEYDREDWQLADDAPSTSNMLNVLPTHGTLDTMSSEDGIQDKFENEYPEVPESSPDDYPDAASNGDNIEPKGDSLNDVWDDEDSNLSTDSLEKGLQETSLASAHTLTVEDKQSNSSIDNEIGLENLKLWDLGNSPVSPMEVLDAHDEDVIPEEDTTISETVPLGTPETCEGVGLQGTGISHHVSPIDSEALEISHCTAEDLEEPVGTSDIVELDGISLFSGFNAQEATKITSSADIKPVNEIDVLLSKSASEAHTSDTTDITSLAAAVSDDASRSKLVEEQDCFEDSGIDELEKEKNSPSDEESDHVEKLGPIEASVSGSGEIVCNSVDTDRPISELSGVVPNSHVTIQSLDREQELLNVSVLENPVLDAPSSPAHNDTEESVQDRFGLPPSQPDQHLLHPVEISPESSPSSPMNHLQMLYNGDAKGESTSVSAAPLANGLGPPSISELSRLSNNGIHAPGYPENLLGSIPPPSNPFLEANQISLSDLPPLPPLPPVQWRMGKLQHAFPSAEEDVTRNEESFPQLLAQTAATDDVGSSLPTKPTHDGPSTPTLSTNDVTSVREEMKETLTEPAAETISKQESLENSCSSSEAKPLHKATNHPQKTETKPEPLVTPTSESHEATDLPQKIETKPHILATPTSESISTSSAAEDCAENGSQKMKFPRPRSPLVDDVSFLDKSKLRKVTERVLPEIPKVEKRDSLLEQIRTKSFNLKPAMASRPSIRTRAPDTNLKVVAILEKANAIRQAFAGSDEDDDDSWSE